MLDEFESPRLQTAVPHLDIKGFIVRRLHVYSRAADSYRSLHHAWVGLRDDGWGSTVVMEVLLHYDVPNMRRFILKEKQRESTHVIIYAGLTIAIFTAVAFAALSQVVMFPDPGLEAAIRSAVSKLTGDIFPDDLEGLRQLSAVGLGISSLEGIQYCTDLVELALADNLIVDLSPVSALAGLSWLDVGNNQITDLSTLAALSNLRDLGLKGNQISDLSPLSGLTSLWTISLWSNQVADLSPLADLTSLRTLDLADNELSDLSPLAGLSELRVLALSGNRIVDISPLSRLSKLMLLDLQRNWIVDLRALENLPRLEELYLQSNRLDLASSSSAMLVVEGLREQGTYVRFEPQASVVVFADSALQALLREILSQATGDIYDSELMEVTELSAANRNIHNLGGIQHCSNLTKLNLANNQVTDLAPLADLSNLQQLDLTGNPLTDITSLCALPDYLANALAPSGLLITCQACFGASTVASRAAVISVDPELLGSVDGVQVAAILGEQTAFVQLEPARGGNVLKGFMPVVGFAPELVTEFGVFDGDLEILPGGRFFAPAEEGVAVLGHAMSRKFGAELGDKVVVEGNTADNVALTVIGILAPPPAPKESGDYAFGIPLADAILVPYETMAVLWEPPSGALVALARAESRSDVQEVAAAVRENLDAQNTGIDVLTFEDVIGGSCLPALSELWLGGTSLDLDSNSFSAAVVRALMNRGAVVHY